MAGLESEDLDRLGTISIKWQGMCLTPAQVLMNLMSMIPKKIAGAIRWVATMGTA